MGDNALPENETKRESAMTNETYLFIDYETTGFKKSGAPKQDGQSRACQVGMILTDATGKIINSFSQLMKPEGWKVSQFNIDMCGITQEDCENYGVSAKAVFTLFYRYASMATIIVAHNADFDKDFAKIEAAYAEMEMPSTPWYCTMKENIHISGGKWPKLNEALQHYCGRQLGNVAHNAMYDVEACKDIFFAARAKEAA